MWRHLLLVPCLGVPSCVTFADEEQEQILRSGFATMPMAVSLMSFQAKHGRWPATQSELDAFWPLRNKDGSPLFRSLVFINKEDDGLMVAYQNYAGLKGAFHLPKPEAVDQRASGSAKNSE